MTKITVISLLTLLILAPLSWSQQTDSAEQSATLTQPILDPNCLDSFEVCQQRAAKREALRQRCAADPEWCKAYRDKKRQLREERKALKKQCQANPEQCQELKQQFQQRQAQRKKEESQQLKNAQMQWCLNNPTACEQWKMDSKQVQQKCQELKNQLREKYPNRPYY